MSSVKVVKIGTPEVGIQGVAPGGVVGIGVRIEDPSESESSGQGKSDSFWLSVE